MAESTELVKLHLENELKELNIKISDKEAQRRILISEKYSDNPNYNEYEKKRSSLICNRKLVDNQLHDCVKEIQNLSKKIDCQRTVLPSTKESNIDLIIQRLETGLRCNTYSLQEEKRIVAEIDSKKRSKKALSEYNCLLKQREALKIKKDNLRKEIELLDTNMHLLRKEEDVIRKKGILSRQTSDNLFNEIKDLQDQVQFIITQLVSIADGNYNAPSTSIVTDVHPRSSSVQNRKSLLSLGTFSRHPLSKQISERNSNSRKCKRNNFEYVDSPEIKICLNLLAYLQNYLLATPSPSLKSAASSVYTTPVATPTDICNLQMADSINILHKDKKKMMRPMQHHPSIILDFLTIDLKPPHLISDIPKTIENLNKKLDKFSIPSIKDSNQSQDIINSLNRVASCNTFSNTTSPEILSNGFKPQLLTSSIQKRNSYGSDSGACELESQIGSSNEITFEFSNIQSNDIE